MERRRLEFSVGIFMIVGLLCLTYLALTLGHLGWGGSRYDVYATFPTVSGLKNKAAVTMAGVNIGEVRNIQLKDGRANVTLSINNDVRLEDDSIAGIKTMGIIGDKYVAIDPTRAQFPSATAVLACSIVPSHSNTRTPASSSGR